MLIGLYDLITAKVITNLNRMLLVCVKLFIRHPGDIAHIISKLTLGGKRDVISHFTVEEDEVKRCQDLRPSCQGRALKHAV